MLTVCVQILSKNCQKLQFCIELALIDGWQCVIKKGEFKPGDSCVYFEIDSLLPIEDRYEFLRKSSHITIKTPIIGYPKEGFRLKTIRLKGQYSQGLALPISSFPELKVAGDQVIVGGEVRRIKDDIADLLNVVKYDPPLPASLSGIAKGNFPSFIPKTDEERIQNLPYIFDECVDEEFECTEKVDGSSMTVYFYDGEFGVCSRNLELKESDSNTFWKVANKSGLRKYLTGLNRNLALQGEVAGEGIQKNPLHLKGQEFFLFNIYDIDNCRYFSSRERSEFFRDMEDLNIFHVPVISSEMKVFEEYKTVDELLEFATSKSKLNENRNREGVVFKSLNKINGKLLSFKAISNKYLLKNDS